MVNHIRRSGIYNTTSFEDRMGSRTGNPFSVTQFEWGSQDVWLMKTLNSLPRGHENKPTYPKDHVPAIRVPHNGSSCASCEYVGKDKKTCTNDYFIKWNGSNVLPYPATDFCSDWYEPADKSLK